MRRTNRTLAAVLSVAVIFAVFRVGGPARADTPATGPATGTAATREQALADMHWMADAQLAALGGQKPIDWEGAAMYAGLAELARVSPNPNYTGALLAMGKQVKWQPIHSTGEPHNADRLAIGQPFLALYAEKRDPEMVAPLKAVKLDPLVEHLNATAGDKGRLTWSWCDALFMAPPVLARMSAVTGDPKYLDAMDKEWKKVALKLYDREEHLFYRDERFINARSKNGRKVFWARGDGWVMAGLPRVMQHMPENYPSRPNYEVIFRQMAKKIASLQGPDGLWRSSLLDPEEFPSPEASGTALYCYGLAWGINAGLLDRDEYLPVVARAWAGLLAARRPDGLLGFIQGVSDRPGPTQPGETKWYGTGAFLLAGTELMKLAPVTLPPSPGLVGAAPPARAFARYVPERKDDVAWENDRIAFRVYGPRLEREEPPPASGSGIDVWGKSTRRMVIDDWYRTGEYHDDHGEGLDFYKVGAARGCGGLGAWDGGKLYISGDWKEHKILAGGPELAIFRLTYGPWDANGRKVWETRTITLEAGSNLNRIESTIESDKPGDLVVGIGISRRPIEAAHKDGEVTQDKDRGLLCSWSAPDPKHGSIGCGVVVDPAIVVGFARDDLNDLVLVKVTAGKPFAYHAGACWSKGLDFKTRAEWEQYLKSFERK